MSKSYNLNYWLCHVGRDLGVVYVMSQSLATNMKRTHMVLVTHSSAVVTLYDEVIVSQSSLTISLLLMWKTPIPLGTVKTILGLPVYLPGFFRIALIIIIPPRQ